MTRKLCRTTRFAQIVEELDDLSDSNIIARHGELVLTRRLSLMAGNCTHGTDRFIEFAEREYGISKGITAAQALTLHSRLYLHSSRYWVVACIAMAVLLNERKAAKKVDNA